MTPEKANVMVKLTNWGKLPTTLSDGSLLPYMSPKDREKQNALVFHASGGFDREVAILKGDNDKFHDVYMNTFVKRLPKPETTIGLSDGVEAILERMDAADRALVINSTAVEVEEPAGA